MALARTRTGAVDIFETSLTMLMRGLAVEQSVEQFDYPSTYAGFIEQELGLTLDEPQRWICDSVENHRRTSARSCHASGKTKVAAGIGIAFLHKHANSRVLTTAASDDSVREGMWQEIRSLYEQAPGRLLGTPGTTRWEIAPNWLMQGLKPADNRPGRFHGRHSSHVLIIADEAIEIAPALLEGLESLMTGAHVRILYLFNPTQIGGPAYESHHAQSAVWNRIVIRAKDTINIREDRTVIPGLIDPVYVEEQRRIHGEDSDWYRSRVEAEFPRNQATAWVTIAQAEAAMKRREMLNLDEPIDFGLDVARSGNDKNVLTTRQGSIVLAQEEWKIADLMGTAGMLSSRIEAILAQHQKRTRRIPKARCLNIDLTGLGAGLADRMRELHRENKVPVRYVTGVNFSSRSVQPDRFPNVRQEMWTILRERFQQDRISGALHAELIADLTGAVFTYISGYPAPLVEKKEDMVKRLKRSPDYADSAALAFYLPPAVQAAGAGMAVPVSVESDHSPYPDEEQYQEEDERW